jgi:hypothetical protein
MEQDVTQGEANPQCLLAAAAAVVGAFTGSCHAMHTSGKLQGAKLADLQATGAGSRAPLSYIKSSYNSSFDGS